MDPKKDENISSPQPHSSHNKRDEALCAVDDFTERLSQQQAMISQLKEIVLAEESARNKKNAENKLKLEKYTSQLARIRNRAKGIKHKAPSANVSVEDNFDTTTENTSLDLNVTDPNPSISNISDTSSTLSPVVKNTKHKVPNREATKILHQQIKEHKATIAERAKNEKELEKALFKIKKQFEENQNQSAEIIQLGQPKPSVQYQTLHELEECSESKKNIEELHNKILQLENNILDLQETCKEKDSVIKSKTEAITLMSADLSKKGKNTLDLLDDTKEQMQQMQENFAVMESNMKLEKQSLLDELEVCKNKVVYLEEANSILEGERFNLSVENNALEEKLSLKDFEINRLNNELLVNISNVEELLYKQKQLEDTLNNGEEKGIAEIKEMENLTKKIEDLEKVNAILKESNLKLVEKARDTYKESCIKLMESATDSSNIQDSSDVLNCLKNVANSLNYRILDIEMSIMEKEIELSKFNQENMEEKLHLASDVRDTELTKKIESLENIIHGLKKSNLDLEEKLLTLTSDTSKLQETSAKSIKSKTKGGQKQKPQSSKDQEKLDELNSFVASVKNLTCMLHSINNEILEKESQLYKKQKEINDVCSRHSLVIEVQKQFECDTSNVIKDNTNICDIITEDTKSLETDVISLRVQLDDALKKIDELNKELFDANKNMVKLKATHKQKLKQMQKSIDDYTKVSDSNLEVVRLQSEVNILNQKITELEDDKGNLQLHLVDYDSDRVPDSQLHIKLLETEKISEERLSAIADLEKQKFELVQELHHHKQQLINMEDRIADLLFLENEHVSCEMKSAQLEEQLDILKIESKKYLQNINDLSCEKNQLIETIDSLNKEKIEINTKLELYIHENMDLIDRLEKLSAEKVSSAESIEMVESLTAQEKMEIEQYQKTFNTNEKDIEEMKDEENFTKTMSEKLELEQQEFTEKIENLQIINNTLSTKLHELLEDKKLLEEQFAYFNIEKNALYKKINEYEKMHLTEDQSVKIPDSESIKTNKIDNAKIDQAIQTERNEDDEKKPKIPLDKKITKEIIRMKNMLKNKEIEIAELQSKLNETTGTDVQCNQIIELQKEIKDNNNAINNLEETIEYLTKESKHIKEENYNKDLSIQSLTEKCIELEKTLQDLMLFKDKYEKAEVICNSLKLKITNSQEEFTKLALENNNLNSSLELLKQENNTLLSRNQSMQIKLTDFNSQFEHLTRENLANLEKLEQKIDENESLKSNVSKINILHELVNTKEEEVKTLITNLENIQHNYHETKSVYETKAQERDAYIECLELEISKSKDKIARLEENVLKVETLENKIKNLLSKVQEKDVIIMKIQQDNDEYNEKYINIESQVKTLQNQLDRTTNEYMEILENLNKANDINIQLQNDSDLNKIELENLRRDLCNLNLLKIEKEKLFDECNDLQSMLKDINNEFNEKLKVKSQEYETLEISLQNQNDNFEIQIEEYKDQFKKIQEELFIKNQQLSDLNQIINQLRVENENIVIEKNMLLSQKTGACEISDVTMCDDLKISNLEEEIKMLSSKLKEKDLEIERYQTHSLQLQMSLFSNSQNPTNSEDHVQNKLQESNNVIDELNKRLNDTLLQIDTLTHAENSMKNEIDSLISLLKEKDIAIKNLQVELNTVHELEISKDVAKQYNTRKGNVHKPNQDLFDIKLIEDQIVSADIVDHLPLNEEMPMIRSFQHDKPTPMKQCNITDAPFDPAIISEEEIRPKKAYLCFDDQETSEKIDIQQMLNDKDAKISELQQNIEFLTEEKTKLASDLSQNQLKTNKALIKLKELKMRNDNLKSEMKTVKSASNVDILNNTIQEELSTQIKNLEDKIKDMKIIYDKELLEKESLLKRVDILSSANDKLINIKEKQDVELQMYITKNEKLVKKLENLEWNSDFSIDGENTETQETTVNLETINFLNEKIKMLQDGNEEFKNLIESKNNELKILQSNINEISEKCNNLDSKICTINSENIDLKKCIENSSNENMKLTEQLNQLNTINADYQQQHSELIIENNEEFKRLKDENLELKGKLENIVIELRKHQENYIEIKNQKEHICEDYEILQQKLKNITKENETLIMLESKYKIEYNDLVMKNKELTQQLQNILSEIDNISTEKGNLQSDLEKKINEIKDIQKVLTDTTSNLNELQQRLLKYENDYNTMEHNLKLQISELEARTEEIENKKDFEIQSLHLNENLNETVKILHETKCKLDEALNTNEKFRETYVLEIEKNEKLSTEYKTLKDVISEKDSKMQELIQSYNQVKLEMSALEETIKVKDSDIQKFYNFESMYNNKFNEYSAIIQAKDEEILNKIAEIDILNENVIAKDSVLAEKIEEIELFNVRLSNYDNLLQQISELETKLVDLSHEKDAELANLRLKFHSERTSIESSKLEALTKISFLENQLEQKIDECRNLNIKLEQLQALVDEESLQLTEMRTALEAQELEIVTLKENLLSQTKAYEKLHRSYTKSERHVSFSEDTKPGDDSQSTSSVSTVKSDDAEKSPPRADLDLALYMLHQRDVRCEELTVELMQLLEERDTLQLKLSNALRTNEDLRAKYVSLEKPLFDPPASPSQMETVDNNASTNVSDNKSNSDLSLESKISELHTVNQLRDVRLKDERENRQKQMELLQRDIEHLPPEAVAQLREAHYTLSRDTQSTSTVLFNWLWGKTTPKVVHM